MADGKDISVYEISDEDVDDTSERKHFQRVVNAFMFYRIHSMKRVKLARKHFAEIPEHHKRMIPNTLRHLSIVEECIKRNYHVIHKIVNNTVDMFENKESDPISKAVLPAREFDMDKVKTTLKQIVRDWSSEGAAERNICYQPVISELENLFTEQQKMEGEGIRILVPGAGLGRLAYEIALRGFFCQGNEFSFYMLFTAHFILNRCKSIDCHTIYPWVHQYCNMKTSADQIRPVAFPDANPADLSTDTPFSMVAGDFLEIYDTQDYWDSVCTVYFIDTAHNIIAYIEKIWEILKPGGYWINMGPLLYHFADMTDESSIEISYEDLKKVILQCNFKIVKEKVDIPSTYTQNPASMLVYQYQCAFFVAQKPLDAAPHENHYRSTNGCQDHNATEVNVKQECFTEDDAYGGDVDSTQDYCNDNAHGSR